VPLANRKRGGNDPAANAVSVRWRRSDLKYLTNIALKTKI
jgi:hypothetical protein